LIKAIFIPLVALLLFAACSNAVDKQKLGADRIVVITMKDNHFEPDRVEVSSGETIAFRFVNRGGSPHDAYIGDAKEQEEHERESRMMDRGGMGGHMTEGEDVSLDPGKVAVLTHTFPDEGRTLIGCHEPGHYAAGMKVSIRIR
jgi:uncharacterized cupredoxin-like copper-binding protein